MTENWKAVVGYEGLYEVSDQGRVRSLWRGKEKILKPEKNRNGYLRVWLYKDGQDKRMYVHRLVAQAFVPNPNNLDTVNHKDEVKTNNVASNLEWMTMAGNTAYSQPQFAARPVQMLDKSTNELLATFPSIHEAEQVTRIVKQNICKCCLEQRKSAGGFKWRYV